MSSRLAFVLAFVATSAPFALADTGTGGGEAPIADAGLGLLAYVGDTVILNGTASSDPEGASVGYDWDQTGGPAVALKGADDADPEFVIEEPGTYRFELVVNDGYQDSEPDGVEIAVPQTDFGGASAGGCNAVAGLGALGMSALAGGLLLLRRRAR